MDVERCRTGIRMMASVSSLNCCCNDAEVTGELSTFVCLLLYGIAVAEAGVMGPCLFASLN